MALFRKPRCLSWGNLTRSHVIPSDPTKTYFREFIVPSHPPSGVTGDNRVVWLDASEQLQQSLFGNLPADPKEAERRAQAVIHSAGWQQKQAELAQDYQGLLQAWSLGLQKYPAVVSDDQYVVYGTADVVVAEGLFHSHSGREGQR